MPQPSKYGSQDPVHGRPQSHKAYRRRVASTRATQNGATMLPPLMEGSGSIGANRLQEARERQQVGLAGGGVDQLDGFADAVRGLRQLAEASVVPRAWPAASPAIRADRPTKKGAASRPRPGLVGICAPGSGCAHGVQETSNLELQSVAVAGQHLRRREHLGRRRAGLAGAALHPGDSRVIPARSADRRRSRRAPCPRSCARPDVRRGRS